MYTLSDLVALRPIEATEDPKNRTATPNSAASLKRGIVVSIGTPRFLAASGLTIEKEIEIGETVSYRASAEDRKDHPAIMQKMNINGEEDVRIIFLSYGDLVYID